MRFFVPLSATRILPCGGMACGWRSEIESVAELADAVGRLASDSDVHVKMQVAYSLGDGIARGGLRAGQDAGRKCQ